ncbi:hypothetical protein DYI95_009370 [Thermaerobacter sp. PB12/4term]|uniref:BatA domain-containing protein n=1 Tax=Thermaerobacter sp. PB12/4term TaxID=2293838 RepID=UPI000E32A941|nr:BatA domain-containing protein [Thermaerobacter sp. PB12/4term]QIA27694.1 hypothetical protein DYI95_009370 [Thermaerobacter sp. PB12/4term]
MPGAAGSIFLTTGWGWLGPFLALLGAGLIVLLYMLRRRPRIRPVPSTLLWQQVVRDQVARRPWQRLRSRLSLWLELLAALALALTLARPALPGGTVPAPGVVWVLDATASMGVEGRWQEAIALLRDDLRRTGPGFRGALLWAGPVPGWLAEPGATAADIGSALDRLAASPSGPAGGTTDWGTVLALAYGAAGALPQGSPVRVVTDGTDPALARELAEPPPASQHPLEVVVTGEPVENTAILAVHLPGPGRGNGPGNDLGNGLASRDPAGSTELTVTLVHYGRQPATVTVVVEPAPRDSDSPGAGGGSPDWPDPREGAAGPQSGGAGGSASPGHTGSSPGSPGASGTVPDGPGASRTGPGASTGSGEHVTAAGSSGDVPPRTVALQPGRPLQVTFSVPGGAPFYRVAVVPGDAYPTDDVAWAIPEASPTVHIGLLAPGEAALIHRALALRPGAQVVRLVPPGTGTTGGTGEGPPPSGPRPAGGEPAHSGEGSAAGQPVPPEGGPAGAGGNGGAGPPVPPEGSPAAGTEGSEPGAAAGAAPGTEAAAALPLEAVAGLDLLVVVGLPLPPGLPESLPVIWIDPPGPSFQPRSLTVAPGGDAARLLGLVPLEGVTLLSAQALEPARGERGPGEVPLLLGDGRPIATYRPPAPGRGGRAVLGFDPYQGTLLLRPAWPLLVQSLVADLAPGGLGAPPHQRAGQVLALAPSPWLTAVTVLSPSGRPVLPGVLDEPGLYRITARPVAPATGGSGGDQAAEATVEAALWVQPDPGESLAVAEGPRVGTGRVPRPQPGRGADTAVGRQGSDTQAAAPAPGDDPSGPGALPSPGPLAGHPAWRWAVWLALAGLAAGTWVVRHEL